MHQESETLELEGTRPGVYAIHNDSPHPLGELLAVRESIDHPGLISAGIKMTQIGPRNDGYIWVCVNTDLAAAQAWFDAQHGPGWFRCHQPDPNTVAMVQLRCPKTGKSIDIYEYRSPGFTTADIFRGRSCALTVARTTCGPAGIGAKP